MHAHSHLLKQVPSCTCVDTDELRDAPDLPLHRRHEKLCRHTYTDIHACVHAYVCVCIYLYLCIYISIYVHIYKYIHTFRHTDIYRYIDTYTHTYERTCMHAYTHTHTTIHEYLYIHAYATYVNGTDTPCCCGCRRRARRKTPSRRWRRGGDAKSARGSTSRGQQAHSGRTTQSPLVPSSRCPPAHQRHVTLETHMSRCAPAHQRGHVTLETHMSRCAPAHQRDRHTDTHTQATNTQERQ